MKKIKLFIALISMTCFGASAQVLSIYCENDMPLQYVNAQGKLVGFSIEITQEIQKRVGNQSNIQMVPWARGISKLNFEPNTLLMTMARTPERESQYQWIGPISLVTYSLYIKADSKITLSSLEDAKKLKSIGVYRGDVRDLALSNLGFNNLDRASSNVSSFKKLMLGRVDAYADSRMGVESLAKAAGYDQKDVKVAHEILKSTLYIAVSKNTNKAIVDKWNQALLDMKKDKTFHKIHHKYQAYIEMAH